MRGSPAAALCVSGRRFAADFELALDDDQKVFFVLGDLREAAPAPLQEEMAADRTRLAAFYHAAPFSPATPSSLIPAPDLTPHAEAFIGAQPPHNAFTPLEPIPYHGTHAIAGTARSDSAASEAKLSAAAPEFKPKPPPKLNADAPAFNPSEAAAEQKQLRSLVAASEAQLASQRKEISACKVR